MSLDPFYKTNVDLNVMGPVEVYKLLPKTNCRKCSQSTCMGFAVALTRGEAAVEECPELDEQTRQKLSQIEIIDWKAELIKKLRAQVQELDLKEIARGIGADITDQGIMVRLFGAPYLISTDGAITTKAYLNPWIEILLLHYVRTAGSGQPLGQWVSFSELKSGMVKASSFRRDCEEPLKKLLDRDFKVVEGFLARLGAKKTEVEGAPFGWYIQALPKIPVLILYWPAQEEHPSELKILFDKTADRFLDVESLMFLFEGLVNMIEKGGFRE